MQTFNTVKAPHNPQIHCKHEFKHDEDFGGYAIWKCRKCSKLEKCSLGKSPANHLLAEAEGEEG